MRKSTVYIFIIGGFLFHLRAHAQCANGGCGAQLINNGGFETSTVNCNVNDIQLYSNQTPVQDWFGIEPYSVGAGSTPDYFNPTCGGSSNSYNIACQTGTCSAGFFTTTGGGNDTREYIQAQLSSPLVAGHSYCFSMIVKSRQGAAGNLLSSSDGIGVWFNNIGFINIDTMNGGAQFLGPGSTINATPQIENPSGNLIGSACVTISGQMCAQGGEQYIVIGNFRDDANTMIVGTNPSNYMYVDEVSLKESCASALNVTLTTPSAICSGSCATITATTTGASGTYSYSWMPGGDTSDAITLCPDVTSTYTLVTTSAGACSLPQSLTDSVTLVVNPLPSSPTISQAGDTLFSPQTFANYQWFFGSDTIAGATNYFYIASQSGNYNLIVTDSNGCSVGVGILNVISFAPTLSEKDNVNIFPNPIHNTFTITFPDAVSGTLEIINPLGEIVFLIVLNGVRSQIVKPKLAQGIYFLKVMLGEKTITRKLVVQ